MRRIRSRLRQAPASGTGGETQREAAAVQPGKLLWRGGACVHEGMEPGGSSCALKGYFEVKTGS